MADRDLVIRAVTPFYLEHQATLIDGVVFHESKELNKVIKEGVEEIHLSHTREIGNRSYTSKKCIVNGAIFGEEMIETSMSTEEIRDFELEWETRWPQQSILAKNDFYELTSINND